MTYVLILYSHLLLTQTLTKYSYKYSLIITEKIKITQGICMLIKFYIVYSGIVYGKQPYTHNCRLVFLIDLDGDI